jgi:fumarate reductase subunit D
MNNVNNFDLVNVTVSIIAVIFMLYTSYKLDNKINPTEEKIIWMGITVLSLFGTAHICEILLQIAKIDIPIDTKILYQTSDLLCSLWGIVIAVYFLKFQSLKQ